MTVWAKGAVYFEGGRQDGRAAGRQGGTPPLAPLSVAASGAVQTALVPAPAVESLDPTGYGDVFGATGCARLLAGDDLETAVKAVNAAAARNATYRGATGLAGFLRGELVP